MMTLPKTSTISRPQSYWDKVRLHANAVLEPTTPETDPLFVSKRLRRFLKIEDQRLRMLHSLGASGCETAAARSFLLDVGVGYAFRHAVQVTATGISGNPESSCALLAVGGYGRAELAPYSDVDLLLVYSGKAIGQTKLVLGNLLRLLWDAGLTVGHGFRTVGDCIVSALDDPHLRTALVNTRFLAGNKGLHNSLCEALEKDRRRRVGSFLTAITRERDARYGRFGATICLQEPNIKESAGGLRDFHTALWMIHARHGFKTLHEARAHDLVSEAEARRALRAYDFLWRVRHSTHFLTRRKTECLSLEMQPALAAQFAYKPGTHLLGSEKLMRDYYRHARELHLFGEAIASRVVENGARTARSWLRRGNEKLVEPFTIRRGRLQFDGEPELFSSNPVAIFNAFALAQAAGVPFDHRLHEAVVQGSRSIGPTSRTSNEVTRAFLALMRRRGRAGSVLRAMHKLGLLARLIPEFGRISLLVQHDLYHHFTVDEHTLRAIEAIDELHLSENKQRAHFRAVLEELEDPTLLHLALLLHDIGKGQGRGHIERGATLAKTVCRRLRLKEEQAEKVVLLVKLHVAMAHLAQRRDLNEPRLIADFAASVGSMDVLNMLLLLTYADLNAVGPGVWSEWKSALLWDLYCRTRKFITGEDAPTEAGAALTQIKEQIAAALPETVPFSEIERQLALLPERYMRVTTPVTIATHIRMAEAVKTGGFDCHWAANANAAAELTVCARDRHGLFADLAGTFAANGIEILSAEVNTREDGIAIDTFVLRRASTRQAVEKHHYQALADALRSAAAGELDVATLVERWSGRNAPRKRPRNIAARHHDLPRISCDNEVSGSSTLLEVHAIDESGLAYKIAAILAELGLEIVCARITTERSDAFDVFYVTDSAGLKLSDEMIQAVEQALRDRLPNIQGVNVRPSKTSERGLHEKSRSDHQTAPAGCR
jgi:[protein-PII] uridylyltransferase